MKNVALFFSYVLHPIFLPTLFLLFILLSPYYMNDMLRPGAFKVLFLTTLLFTFFILAFILSIAKMARIIESYQLRKKKERVFALIIMILSSYFAWRAFIQIELPSFYRLFLFLFIGILLLTTIISGFYKISLHMVGWGAFTALSIFYILKFDLNMSLYLIPIFLSSGIAAWARLELNSHTPAQVYSGYGIGLSILLFWVC